MLDSTDTPNPDEPTADSVGSAATDAAETTAPPRKRAPRKRATKQAESAPAEAEKPPTQADPATDSPPARKRAPRKAAAKKAATPAAASAADAAPAPEQAAAPPAKRARRTAKKTATPAEAPTADAAESDAAATPLAEDTAPPAKKTPRKRAAKKTTAPVTDAGEQGSNTPALSALFMAPAERDARAAAAAKQEPEAEADVEDEATSDPDDVRKAAIDEANVARRRRRRGRRGRGGAKAEGSDQEATETAEADTPDAEAGSDAGSGPDAESGPDGEDGDTASAATRRRRRRRRSGSADDDSGGDDPPNTVTHVREKKSGGSGGSGKGSDDGVRGVKGSTRLEAKRQRRRDGRDTNRRRAPILTEAEFLARREDVDRRMAVRQLGDRTQIAVLEDGILVEHYVTRASATSYVGNVYLGRVQNVLPSMEAAFVDIGKGRNGVLYAGEVNWDAAGLEGKSRAIEQALKSGDAVLVQVTKDPIGHKGARLTSQISLPGRFVVYVPGGGMTGISRRLPDTERRRLKSILKKIVPDEAGVIVRTAAEGASEEDLTHDVERLQAQWEAIQEKAKQTKSAPTLVHGEPDLAIRVVRDVFNEDFASLVVQGDDAWSTVSDYIGSVAPDLGERVSRHTADTDLFHDLRVDEQLMKALDRKVWLPSGGSLVIDRTEAMTVIDVNTGKFIGSGGNLEQTVTRNNIEAAEEIVRQLRLRDVGGIVVIDFIDMVLESNRELVLRRLTECLGRDRTKHQVAEVTSLGLVQMTRKRVGEGLLEAFSEPCEVCKGRGVIIHGEPVEQTRQEPDDEAPQQGKRRKRGGRSNGSKGSDTTPEPEAEPAATPEQRQAATAAIAAIHRAASGSEEDGADGVADGGVVAELASNLVAAAMDAGSGGASQSVSESASASATNGVRVEVEQPASPTEEAVAAVAAVEAPAAAEDSGSSESSESEPKPARRRRRAASRPAGPPVRTA